MRKYLSPSVLSADFTRIDSAVKLIEEGGADWVHCDVMDGVFVPNISFGQKMVADIKRITRLTIDVHLMITEPIKYVEEFAKYADIITFHIEAEHYSRETVEKIKGCGKRVGIAVKPSTDIETLFPFLGIIDMALIMSVEPGFGGQSFMPSSIDKIKALRKIAGDNLDIQVDGGINEKNIFTVIEAGANSIVTGSVIFSALDSLQMTKNLKKMLL